MKKGSLSLSTTAIVVLIVAIVVLGFTITFIARGFGNIEELVEKEAGKIPEPPQPSAANPLTISVLPTAEIGGQFVAKVSVYNVCNVPVDVLHQIDCRDPAGGATITLERTTATARALEPGQRTTMAYLANVNPATGTGRSLCTASLSAWAQGSGQFDNCALEEYTATASVEFIE
jgi:hypothetical protein